MSAGNAPTRNSKNTQHGGDTAAGTASTARRSKSLRMCRLPSFKASQPQPRWYAVVPVLFLDFLVMALPGGILPIMINDHYGPRSYVLVGYAQSLKGMLAFVASPAIGALSDAVGRKYLFLACVLGTASPYAALGLGCSLDTHLLLLGLSGILAATFPLAFADICDVVPEGSARTSAIGAPLSAPSLRPRRAVAAP